MTNKSDNSHVECTEAIRKKKEKTGFSAYLIDTMTNRIINKINLNIEIDIPSNTKIVYVKKDKKSSKNSHSYDKDCETFINNKC
ncbi:unnamed protein product [Brachionus calyciflorus]|uniref:Uncharacterized protein n=1 Tax=Brachionus calyciflorus TaxID=104777 RepID=A0A813SQX3_9BILA|nr:unnamed protein product [Brachionus calyciflorus]